MKQCDFPGIDAQFQQIISGNGANALNTFKYGKYCGASNFDPTGSAPCNPIDAACQAHDACYAADDINTSNPFTQERLDCNDEFILELVDAIDTGSDACDETGAEGEGLLCDDNICEYEEIGQNIICIFCGIYLEDLLTPFVATSDGGALAACLGDSIATAFIQLRSGFPLASYKENADFHIDETYLSSGYLLPTVSDILADASPPLTLLLPGATANCCTEEDKKDESNDFCYISQP